MGAVLVTLIPMIIGSTIAPGVLSLNLVVLRGTNGIAKSWAFIIGALLVRLLQGLCFGYIFSAATVAIASKGKTTPITSTLLLFMGLMFVIVGIKAYLNEPDPDAPSPKWISMIQRLTSGKLFILGILWALASAKGWVFTLAALNIIRDADLSPLKNTLTYLMYTLGCMALFLIPVILSIVSPERAHVILARAEMWITRNKRPIMVVISACFGAWFLYKGIVGLLA